MAVALVALLAAPAAADSSIPGRARALKRTPNRAVPIGREVVRAAVRDQKLAPHIPRTGLTAVTPAEQRLFKEIDRVTHGRYLRRSNTAVFIQDARTGQEIYAVREDEGLNPASNVKLVATAAALDVLGPDWRYQTRLFGPTPTEDGIVDGDIYLRGTFDPTFSVKHLDNLAQTLADSGLVRVDGDILIGTLPDRDAVARAKLEIQVRGVTAGELPEVTVTPETNLVDVEITAKTVTRGRSRLKVRVASATDELGNERVKLTVEGRIRRGTRRTYWRTVRNRPLFTAHALRSALAKVGVEITGTARQMEFADYVRMAGPSYLPIQLARHRSPPLSYLVKRINKRSINRWADRVIMTAGAAAYGGEPTMEKGVRLMGYWLESRVDIGRDDVLLDTGSGLSYNTELSARQVVEVLREAAGLRSSLETATDTDRLAQVHRESLAIAGRDGTLRRRFRRSGVRGNMFGKTGTLTRIIALSGIIETDDGRALTFAIVTNDHRPGYRYRVRKEHERIVNAIYRYLQSNDE